MIEAEPRPMSNSMPRLAPYADASNANACSQGGPAPTDYLMETVFIQIRAPKGNDAGKVLEGHYKVIGDVVTLVDKGGKALASDDKKYSRNLVAGENPKQVAAQLLRQHYNATRTGPRDFNRAIVYPKLVY